MICLLELILHHLLRIKLQTPPPIGFLFLFAGPLLQKPFQARNGHHLKNLWAEFCTGQMLFLSLSLSAAMHAPFMRQCWGLQVGPMHETAWMGKLINAALISLIRRVWVYAVLPSSWVNSSALLVCRHDRVTREVGRVGLVGRDRGRRGYWVALYQYIYTARLLMWVFL